MTGEQYKKQLDRLNLSSEECQAIFGYSRRTEIRWRTKGPPAPVAALILLAKDKYQLAEFMALATRKT